MASLAACSTLSRVGRTHRSAPTDDTIGLSGARWVEGVKAGRDAGRRQECLPHKKRLHHSRGGDKLEANHRQDCRCGTQDCVLHANIRCGTQDCALHANIRCGTQDCVLHGEPGVASRAACSTRAAGVAGRADCSTGA